MNTSIPENTMNTLNMYVHDRIRTGGFLQSVLENDLMGAVAKSDNHNRLALADIVQYIYNEMPMGCWGSPQAVEDWLSGKTQLEN
mgnify:CR=1 FL=1